MLAPHDQTSVRTLHPLPAVLLASAFGLFLAALLSDIAYASSYEIQWKNFASWLIVGALVLGGFTLLWAIVDLLRADVRRERRWVVYCILVLAMWVAGFLNALIHAEDAWSGASTGLILSAVILLLALGAIWIGFASFREGARK